MRLTLELGRAIAVHVGCHWRLFPTYWRHRWLWIDLRLERGDIAGFVLMLLGFEFSVMVRR